MMQAKLIHDYRCAPTGAITETFRAGDIVSGKVAELALADGAAIEHREVVLEHKTRRKKAGNGTK